MKKYLHLTILIFAALLSGCKETPEDIKVTGIELNEPELDIFAGDSFDLVATVLPAGASAEIVFTSNNASVATVDEKTGHVVAVSPGEATITVSSLSGGAYTNCRVTVRSTVRNIGENESANCYIVSEPGLVGFKPFKGNTEIIAGNVESVDVLWETVNTEIAPFPGTVIKDPQYKDGMVAFRVPEPPVEGNALIAAKDASGIILWSWHIWVVTDEIQEITMANNAGIMMDRNLGAIGKTPGDARCNGLMYQWGRKDPFMGLAAYGRPLKRYAASSEMEPNVAAGPELTIAYTIAHPTAWGLRDEKNCDWLSTGDYTTETTRWAINASPKALYDPCPAGWRLPGNSGIWSTAGLQNNTSDNIVFDEEHFGAKIGAPYCTPDSWWPTTGQLANDYVRGVDNYLPGVYGGIWTGATTGMGGGTNNAGRDMYISLASKTVYQGNNEYKQFGLAVRCCKIID